MLKPAKSSSHEKPVAQQGGVEVLSPNHPQNWIQNAVDGIRVSDDVIALLKISGHENFQDLQLDGLGKSHDNLLHSSKQFSLPL